MLITLPRLNILFNDSSIKILSLDWCDTHGFEIFDESYVDRFHAHNFVDFTFPKQGSTHNIKFHYVTERLQVSSVQLQR